MMSSIPINFRSVTLRNWRKTIENLNETHAQAHSTHKLPFDHFALFVIWHCNMDEIPLYVTNHKAHHNERIGLPSIDDVYMFQQKISANPCQFFACKKNSCLKAKGKQNVTYYNNKYASPYMVWSNRLISKAIKNIWAKRWIVLRFALARVIVETTKRKSPFFVCFCGQRSAVSVCVERRTIDPTICSSTLETPFVTLIHGSL